MKVGTWVRFKDLGEGRIVALDDSWATVRFKSGKCEKLRPYMVRLLDRNYWDHADPKRSDLRVTNCDIFYAGLGDRECALPRPNTRFWNRR